MTSVEEPIGVDPGGDRGYIYPPIFDKGGMAHYIIPPMFDCVWDKMAIFTLYNPATEFIIKWHVFSVCYQNAWVLKMEKETPQIC